MASESVGIKCGVPRCGLVEGKMKSLSQLFVLLAVCAASVLGHCQKQLCDGEGNGKFAAILPDTGSDLLLIKGDKYWRVSGNLTDGFKLSDLPKNITSYWPGLPSSIDGAVYRNENQTTYFEKDGQVWAYKDRVLLEGHPRPFSVKGYLAQLSSSDDAGVKRIAELAEHSHAVGIFPGASHMYFFNGTQYSKYRLPDGPIEDGYPKPVVPFWFQCPKTDKDSSEENTA